MALIKARSTPGGHRRRRHHDRSRVRGNGHQERGVRRARPASRNRARCLRRNTSYLDVNAIAQTTKRPQDVLGMHFFSPANVMKLLEIVRGKATAPDVLATAIAVGRKIGKVPVVVGRVPRLRRQPHAVAAAGTRRSACCSRARCRSDVDAAAVEFGFPMGPFAMGDLAGLDVGWRIRRALGLARGDCRRALRSGPFRPEDRQGLLYLRARLAHAGSTIPKSRR